MSPNPHISGPAAQCWSGAFDDFDQMAEHIAAWDVHYEQLAPGAFHAKVALAAMPSTQILTIHWNRAMSNLGSAPVGKRSFALPLQRWGRLRYGGSPVAQGAVMTARGGADFHLVTTGSFTSAIASLDLGFLDRQLQSRFGCSEHDLGNPRLLRCREESIAVMAGQALDVLGRKVAGEPPAALPRLEAQAAAIVLSALTTPADVPIEPPRQRLARLIEEILRDGIGDPPNIGDLCAMTGATERTLHWAFRQTYGMGPITYLRRLRLNAVRRALLRAEEATVTATAIRFGFFHFGRFAADYAKLFGEVPSNTFRRGTGDRPRSCAAAPSVAEFG